MKFLIFLPCFVLGCTTDTFFVSKSVLKEIKQRCSNLSTDIQKETDHLIARDIRLIKEINLLTEKFNRLIEKDNISKQQLQSNLYSQIKLSEELVFLRKEMNSFMESNKSVFIDCISEKKFNLFVENIRLLKESIIFSVENDRLQISRSYLTEKASQLKKEIVRLVQEDNRLANDNNIFKELIRLKEKETQLFEEGISLLEEKEQLVEEYEHLNKNGEWERANQLVEKGNHIVEEANRLFKEANQLLERQNHMQEEFIILAN